MGSEEAETRAQPQTRPSLSSHEAGRSCSSKYVSTLKTMPTICRCGTWVHLEHRKRNKNYSGSSSAARRLRSEMLLRSAPALAPRPGFGDLQPASSLSPSWLRCSDSRICSRPRNVQSHILNDSVKTSAGTRSSPVLKAAPRGSRGPGVQHLTRTGARRLSEAPRKATAHTPRGLLHLPSLRERFLGALWPDACTTGQGYSRTSTAWS